MAARCTDRLAADIQVPEESTRLAEAEDTRPMEEDCLQAEKADNLLTAVDSADNYLT